MDENNNYPLRLIFYRKKIRISEENFFIFFRLPPPFCLFSLFFFLFSLSSYRRLVSIIPFLFLFFSSWPTHPTHSTQYFFSLLFPRHFFLFFVLLPCRSAVHSWVVLLGFPSPEQLNMAKTINRLWKILIKIIKEKTNLT